MIKGSHKKTVYVEAHTRELTSRIYDYVCKECDRRTLRETFSFNCPLYCEKCRPPREEIKGRRVNQKQKTDSKYRQLSLVG
jgi:hypothetical protein